MAKEKSVDTYNVVIRCLNCGLRERREVAVGELVRVEVAGEECVGCECSRAIGGWVVEACEVILEV